MREGLGAPRTTPPLVIETRADSEHKHQGGGGLGACLNERKFCRTTSFDALGVEVFTYQWRIPVFVVHHDVATIVFLFVFTCMIRFRLVLF